MKTEKNGPTEVTGLKKYLLYYFFIAVIPVLAISLLGALFGGSILVSEAEQGIYSVLNERVERIEDFLLTQKERAASIVEIDHFAVAARYLIDGKKGPVPPYHGNFEDSINELCGLQGYYDILIVDRNGNTVYSVKKESDFGGNFFTGKMKGTGVAASIKKAMSEGTAVISKTEYYEPSGGYWNFIAAPIKNGAAIKGCAVFQLGTRDIYSLVIEIKGLGTTGEILIGTLEKEKIVFLTELKNLKQGSKLPVINMGGKLAAPMQRALKGETGRGVLNDYRGVRVMAAWGNISEFGWGVVVKKDYSEIMLPVRVLYLLMFISALILSGLAYFAARKNTEDIQKADLVLRESDKYNRALIEASLDPLVTIDSGGGIKDVNAATENATGLTRKQLVGTDFSLYFTDPAKAKAGYEKVFREGEVKDYELGLKHKNGDVTTVLYNASLYKDSKGDAAGVFAAARDISELKAAEKRIIEYQAQLEARVLERTAELRKSRDMLENMSHIGKIGAWEYFPDTGGEKWTKETYRIMGADQASYSFNLEKETALFEEGSRKIFAAAIGETIKNGTPYDIDLEMTSYDGVHKYVHCSGKAEMDAGKVVRVFGTIQDITESKKLELELLRSNKDLEQFAFVASHDLQEPLRAITGYLQLLEMKFAPDINEDAKRFIQSTVNSAARMRALINDLLIFSRIDRAGKAPAKTDMNSVFDAALFGLDRAINESGALVKKTDLPFVMADETQMTQLLQNLIGNAIKFREKEKPVVEVAAAVQGDTVLFSVSDNGIGIDKQFFERIFVIFQRLHTKEEYPGTGMGLAICRKIVEKHGGKIWVESAPGKGSVFYFTLKKGE